MKSTELVLSPAPSDPRKYDLWLQPAAGFLLFQRIYQDAIRSLPADLPEEARGPAVEALQGALYAVMQVADGIHPGLSNGVDTVEVSLVVKHGRSSDGEFHPISELDLTDGDGMCMGYHYWTEGDFGAALRKESPI